MLRIYALDQLPTFVDIEPVLAFFESLSPYGLAHYVRHNRVDDDGFFHMLARYAVQQFTGPSVLTAGSITKISPWLFPQAGLVGTLTETSGLIDAGLKLRTMRLPDAFQDQDKPELQYDEAGLNAPQIVDTVLKALRHNSAGVEEAGARA